MKKLIFFLALSFITSLVFAQNQHKIDSLEQVLLKVNTGSERLEIIEELFLLHESSLKREYYYEEAKQNFKERTDDLTLAHIQFMQAKIKCEQKIYSPELLEISKNILIIYKKEQVKEKYIVRALSLIAEFYQLNNQIKLAVEYSLKAIKLVEESKTMSSNEKERILAIAYIKLANKTSVLKDVRAVEYSTKGIRILEKRLTPEKLVGAYGNHSLVLRRAKLYDSALVYAHKMNFIIENTDQNKKKAKLAYMIATIYSKMNKIDLATEYAKKSLTYFQGNSKEEVESSMLLYLLGKLYQQKQQYSEAISYFDKTIEVGNKYNMLDVLYNAHLKLSEVYKTQNNTDKAYSHLLKTQVYQDSINNRRRETDTKELVQKYETVIQRKYFEVI
jgi:tetratricopeptide (TPR) repeat protein